MNGVLEGGEEMVPLCVREWRLRLILKWLGVDGSFDHGHELTSHRISRYPTWDGHPLPPVRFDPVNLITLSDAQLALVRSTLQKQANSLMDDMNAGGDWSDVMVDLVNDQHDLIQNTLKELDDCNTPKVVKPKQPTLQQQNDQPVWEGTTSAAKQLNLDAKTLYNYRAGGKLKSNKHWKKQGASLTWNVAALRQWFSKNSQ